MTLQTDRQHDTETTHQHSTVRQPKRYWSLLAVLLAIAIAGIGGVAVTAYLTRPDTTTNTVYHEPNPNTREGRGPTPTTVDNPNTREGRVSSTG